jgi:hypothetical protein
MCACSCDAECAGAERAGAWRQGVAWPTGLRGWKTPWIPVSSAVLPWGVGFMEKVLTGVDLVEVGFMENDVLEADMVGVCGWMLDLVVTGLVGRLGCAAGCVGCRPCVTKIDTCYDPPAMGT